ncbi:MAG TPA: efflux RND transporter periplasmic adaptor subunit [Candidatus Acidoferrum sp.]|nr:efflux RND transporter periplasmic adaptor subunit [Candidatus Acidoferrum sp.]
MTSSLNSIWLVSRNWPSIVIVALVVGGAAGCNSSEKEPTPIVSVQVETVQKGPVEQVVSAEGVVFPKEQAVITPKITSTIKKFLVQRGSRVRKGQVLAVLENADLSAAAQQSKGEFEQAEASYTTTTAASLPEQIQKAELDAVAAKAAFDAQQKVYDSRKELFDQGAIPRRDLDSAQVSLAQARSQSEVAARQLADLRRVGEQQGFKSAQGQLAAAKGKYLGAAAQLSYSEIRSPINGYVTDRQPYEGELATANQPLLTVMDTSTLVVKSHIAQSDAAELKVGDPAKILVAGADNPIAAKVTLVSPALDPGSTTIEVWVQSLKANPELKPGMTAQITATARAAKDALTVPASAIFKNEDGAEYVVLAGADNHAAVKTVQVGIRGKERVQITSGVNAGDKIIISGGYALPDKTQIKVEAPQSAESGKKESSSGTEKE